jgi:hypothetical protein
VSARIEAGKLGEYYSPNGHQEPANYYFIKKTPLKLIGKTVSWEF